MHGLRGEHDTAPQAASRQEHEAIVQIPIERGANVKTPGGERGMALQAAVSGGHADVVQRLVDSGADVKVRYAGNDSKAASQRVLY